MCIRDRVCSVLAVVLLFTFVIRLIGVDGHSMVTTPVSYTHLDVYKRQP